MDYYQSLFQHYSQVGITLFTVILLVWIVPLNTVSAQTPLAKRVDFEVKNLSVADAILELGEVAQLSIAFNSHLFSPQQRVSLSVKNQTIEFILNDCLKETTIGFKIKGKRIVLFEKEVPLFSINGYIEDEDSGEKLIAAAVWDANLGIGTTTNEYGFFSLRLPRGEVSLQFSYLGYQVKKKRFNLQKNNRIKVELKPFATLVEILVTDKNTDENSSQLLLGNETLIVANDIHQSTALVGEHDLIRHLKTTEGVLGNPNGFGGMYVRGGGADQNLVLLDGVPVFNPFHSLGLFSVFSTSMIRNAHFLKEGFSAKYGGRLSSVLNIRNKEGNTRNFGFEAESSLVSTRIIVEIPLVKNKSGLLVSTRRSHLDPLIKGISRSIKQLDKNATGEANYFFYDLNVKFHTSITKDDRLFLSFYTGKDAFNNTTRKTDTLTTSPQWETISTYENWQHIEWGNTIFSLRLNHIFGEKLFSNTTLTYSSYKYFSQKKDQLKETISKDTLFWESYFTSFRSIVKDASIKTDFDYYLNNKHKLIFGAGLLFRDFRPGAIFNSFRFDDDIDIEIINDSLLIIDNSLDDFENLNDSLIFEATEFNFHIEDTYQLSTQFRLLFGLHAALFSSSQKTYFSLQPRLSAEWTLNPIFKTYFSFGKMTQFLHVLSSSDVGTPTDLWVPSTAKVKPEQAWQSSLSIAATGKKGYTAKISAYYKKMSDLIRYGDEISIPNIDEIDPLFWEDDVIFGKGRSYGIETQFQKTKGNIKAGISYTYARSFRIFDDLNEGKIFPFAFDQPHNLKINFSRKLGKKALLNLIWTYHSGRAITLISTDLPLNPFNNFGSRNYEQISPINGHQLPAYHHLDIGVNFKLGKKRLNHFLNIGIYNIYNQLGVSYEYWLEAPEHPEIKELIQSNSLPFLPAINYRIRFSDKER